ncbi:PAS domain protein [uncultured archaeon]|nr:PAS domain protein [uncultured archaeon]
MKKEKTESNHNDDLRHQAEELLKDSRNELVGSETVDGVDAMALVHELQVHQIELEMQNEELKRAKLETEDALTKYSDLYDFSPIGLFSFDQQGLIQEANLAGAALLGIERRNLMNRPFYRFVVPKDRNSFDEFCKTAFETSTKQTCDLSLLRDGEPTNYARIEGIAADDDSPNGRQCRIAVIDITERKKAEEKLRVNRDRFRAIFDRAGMGIVIANEMGCIEDCNAAFSEMLGYDKEELLQKYFKDITFSEDFDRNLGPVRQMVAGQIDKYQMEKRYMNRDGREIWCNLTSSAIRGENGELVHSFQVERAVKRQASKVIHC